MTALLRYIGYTLSLILTETAMCVVLFLIEEVFIKTRVDSWHVEKAIRDGLEVNAVRFIFYYAFYSVPFIVLVSARRRELRLWHISLANCALYLVVSGFYGALLPGAFEYFHSDFFWFLVLSTALSPFVVGRGLQRRLLGRPA